MQDVIHLLPESLANQIAAGEVVQRPASVVKELLENSIDAKSEHIQLIIKDAGKQLILVTDDGVGMSETDARMSFERHATSKITKTDDLFAIRTFGFRGEALASIAAVAQVEMKTCQTDDDTGVMIQMEGSELKNHEPVVCSTGTAISVKNLFYNVPARRKFLKSNPVEFRHILDEFHRVALAHPEVSLSLYQDDLEVFNLRAGKLAKRIVGLFGKNYQDRLIPCQEEVQHVQVTGFIGKPETARKTRGEQFFFVNDRFIRHPYLHHAVVNAFEGLIGEGYFPFYAIYIYLDPKHVDVNVHPTKTEVKFDDERTMYAIVHAAVKQALAGYGVAPSLDFNYDVNFSENSVKTAQVDLAQIHQEKYGRSYAEDNRAQNNLVNWEKLYTPNEEIQAEPSGLVFTDKNGDENSTEVKVTTFSSAANEISSTEDEQHATTPKTKHAIQIRNKYILFPTKSGLMMVNQRLAYERILYDKFLEKYENKTGASQKLVFPKTLAFSPTEFSLLQAWKSELHALGFSFEELGQETIVLNGLPVELRDMDEKETLEAIIEQIKYNQTELSTNRVQKITRAMAKRATSSKSKPLEQEEMNGLIEQLFNSSNPNYTPEGKKIVAMLYMDDIEKLFE